MAPRKNVNKLVDALAKDATEKRLVKRTRKVKDIQATGRGLREPNGQAVIHDIAASPVSTAQPDRLANIDASIKRARKPKMEVIAEGPITVIEQSFIDEVEMPLVGEGHPLEPVFASIDRKRAALAAAEASIAADARALAETSPYAQHAIAHVMPQSPAPVVDARAELDAKAAKWKEVSTETICADETVIKKPATVQPSQAFVVEAYDEVPEELQDASKRKPGGVEKPFWMEMINAKKAQPNKHFQIFLPQEFGTKGKPISISNTVSSANRRLAEHGVTFKVKEGVKKNGVLGAIVWIELETYNPIKRANRKFDPANPTAHLTKPVLALYNALVVAKLSQVNQQLGVGGNWYAVEHEAVKVVGMNASKRADALTKLQEAKLFSYGENTGGIAFINALNG